MACDVLRAEMVKLNGVFPRNADGTPLTNMTRVFMMQMTLES
jgi:hypothetical protein